MKTSVTVKFICFCGNHMTPYNVHIDACLASVRFCCDICERRILHRIWSTGMENIPDYERDPESSGEYIDLTKPQYKGKRGVIWQGRNQIITIMDYL